jgi:Cdc6-like AAA superfamily ATPase
VRGEKLDYLSAIKSIESIFEVGNELNDNNCILVNGEWGIGKTYAIKEWIRRNESKYNVKYISVFGKLTTRDIENDILINGSGDFNCIAQICMRGFIK